MDGLNDFCKLTQTILVGVVVGTEFCGAESAAVRDPTFWTVGMFGIAEYCKEQELYYYKVRSILTSIMYHTKH